jgi:integrase/recombinase XerD
LTISLERSSSNSLDDKIAILTEGIEGNNNNIRYVTALLKETQLQSEENTITICDYIVSLVNESNPVPRYKQTQIQLLCYLSRSCYDKKEQRQRKVFSEMTRDDVMAYLNKLRKSESESPLHKWIGTYNLRRTNLIRFFKWLYHPDILPSKDRPIPDVVKGIPKLKRKEISTVKSTDLWSEDDDYLFLLSFTTRQMLSYGFKGYKCKTK